MTSLAPRHATQSAAVHATQSRRSPSAHPTQTPVTCSAHVYVAAQSIAFRCTATTAHVRHTTPSASSHRSLPITPVLRNRLRCARNARWPVAQCEPRVKRIGPSAHAGSGVLPRTARNNATVRRRRAVLWLDALPRRIDAT